MVNIYRFLYYKLSSLNILKKITFCQAQGPLSRPQTPRQVYEKKREDPEIGSVMGWPTHPPTFFELKTAN